MKTPLLFALAFATSISMTAYLTPVIAQAQQQQAQDQDEENPADIQLGESFELLLELAVVLGALFRIQRAGLLFEHGIRLQLLLNDVLQFQSRRLQYMQTLLQLWREHLLHRQILELMNPRTCHMKTVTLPNAHFRRAPGELQGSRTGDRQASGPYFGSVAVRSALGQGHRPSPSHREPETKKDRPEASSFRPFIFGDVSDRACGTEWRC